MLPHPIVESLDVYCNSDVLDDISIVTEPLRPVCFEVVEPVFRRCVIPGPPHSNI